MVQFEDVQIQLIDLPPISETYTEGWVYGLIRNADRLCVLIDLSAGDPEEVWLDTLALLETHKLSVVGGKREEIFGSSTGVQKALICVTKWRYR